MRRKLWICKKCDLEVSALSQPESREWSDGHVCVFELKKEQKAGVPVSNRVYPKARRR